MTMLIAGAGNIFLGDDGFGGEVVRQLAAAALPPGTEVADYGISGMHLAYELLDGYDTTILVDATSRGGEPGTLYVLEGDAGEIAVSVDAHGMQPDAVFALLRLLGGDTRLLVVGCEPADVEPCIGLSAAVAAAVPEARRVVTELAWRIHGGRSDGQEAADSAGRRRTGGVPG